MMENPESGETAEILTDPRSGDAYVTLAVCPLGKYARSAVFLRGLVEGNFFRTDLSGFAFAVSADGSRLVIQDRLPAADLEDDGFRRAYREKSAAMLVRAHEIVEMLKSRADAAAEEVAR